jgi:hypothetical protein
LGGGHTGAMNLRHPIRKHDPDWGASKKINQSN